MTAANCSLTVTADLLRLSIKLPAIEIKAYILKLTTPIAVVVGPIAVIRSVFAAGNAELCNCVLTV